jgi:hypothetical protein
MSMSARRHDSPATVAATVCGALVIAGQTAGKAARDALFLSQFSVTKLPALLVASAVLSVIAALATARMLTRRSPASVVPAANGASAVLLLGEWLLYRHFPGPAAVAVYIHQAVLGGIIVSGFYSVVSERFDPRSARRALGTIGAGSTLGGILGALLAERTAALVGPAAILPALAALQLVAAAGVARLARGSGAPPRQSESPRALLEALRGVRRVALLRHLALLVLVGDVATVLLDYVFKARASAAYGGEELLRFFATYYGGVGVLTAVVQWTIGRGALERWGVGRVLAALPVAVVGLGATAAAVPALVTVIAARGGENVVRNALFRQAYEVLYTALPPSDKRASKTLIDVGVDRLGDAVGGALIALGLYAGGAAQLLFLGLAVALAVVVLGVVRRVQGSYVAALERGLSSRAVDLALDDVDDRTTRETLLRTIYRLTPDVETAPPPPVGHPAADPLLQRAAELRSTDAAVVRTALAGPLPAALVAYAIPLLAWNEVAPAAIEALRLVATRSTGQLVDALIDPDQEFSVRRRLPRVLAAAPDDRARDGLMLALADARFEVRYQATRALAILRRGGPAPAAEAVLAAVRRELEASDRWRELRILDAHDDVVGDLELVVQERSNRGLEHVFNLLQLVLSPETVRIAYRALHTDDRALRGTALEYLEQVLPPDVRDAILPCLDADARGLAPLRPQEHVVAELVASSAAIHANLRALARAPSARS